MKVLVTGAGGFLGQAVVRRLVMRGHTDVRCMLRSSKGVPALAAIQDTFPTAGVEVRSGNLLRSDDVRRCVEDVEVVFHLAAVMTGGAADIFLNTVVASRNLLDAAVSAGVRRIVLVSSFGVYGTADLPHNSMVDEETPLETHPEQRDHYSHAKLRQEALFREYARKHDFELVILRPGVIYGPGGDAFSTRVGIRISNWLLFLGGRNTLPLAYVENCAEAVALAAESQVAQGSILNVHDDDLPTAADYLRAYRRSVGGIRVLPVPYPVLAALAGWLERYSRRSGGQLPAVFTPYRTRTTWRRQRYSNARLKAAGWRQLVPTDEGLRATFGSFLPVAAGARNSADAREA